MTSRSLRATFSATLRPRVWGWRSRIGAFALAALVVAGVLVAVTVGGAGPSWSFGAFAGYYWRGHVTTVRATWTVPIVLVGSPRGFAGTWIGAQAPGTAGPFIQIGTNEERTVDVSASGTRVPEAFSWAFWSDTDHRFLPQLLFTVEPGDQISASLMLTRTRWQLTLADTTSGKSAAFSTSDEAHGSFNQAEWSQEHVMDPHDDNGYPRLSPVEFGHLVVNSAAPSYGALYSEWMSLASNRFVAPGPLIGDSFTVGPAMLTPTGEQYLRIALPANAALRAFAAEFDRWTPTTPRARIAAQSAIFVASQRSSLDELARSRWPARIRDLVHLLIRSDRRLLDHARSAAHLTPAGIASWLSTWNTDDTASSRVAHSIRRALRVPESTPPT